MVTLREIRASMQRRRVTGHWLEDVVLILVAWGISMLIVCALEAC